MKIVAIAFLIVLFASKILVSQNSEHDQKLFVDIKNGKFGFVDMKGKRIIKHKYDYAEDFSNNLALVQLNGKYGFIDHNGEPIIDLKFDFAESFVNGYALVVLDTLHGLINPEEELFQEQWYSGISSFKDGYTKIEKPNNFENEIFDNSKVIGYMDINGVLLANRWFSDGSEFENGKAKVSVNGKTFYLNTLGTLIERECEECDEALSYLNRTMPGSKEELPVFPGGIAELLNYISENVKYPDLALKNRMQDKVIVSFHINTEGEIIRPKVVRGRYPVLNEEAIRVVRAMPKWKPGKLNGKPICVPFKLPINFMIM